MKLDFCLGGLTATYMRLGGEKFENLQFSYEQILYAWSIMRHMKPHRLKDTKMIRYKHRDQCVC